MEKTARGEVRAASLHSHWHTGCIAHVLEGLAEAQGRTGDKGHALSQPARRVTSQAGRQAVHLRSVGQRWVAWRRLPALIRWQGHLGRQPAGVEGTAGGSVELMV